jgi:hypothetical protein
MLKGELYINYPEESVELGENWEVIAQIFYKLGYEQARSLYK